MQSIPQVLITTYLEMISPDEFRPGFLPDSEARGSMRLGAVDVPFYKFLYQAVGEAWRWRDRLLMPEAELEQILAQP